MKKLHTYYKRVIFEQMRAITALCPPDQINFHVFTLRLIAMSLRDDVMMFDCMEFYLQHSAGPEENRNHYYLRYFDTPDGLQVNLIVIFPDGAGSTISVCIIRGMYLEDYGL
jgi:hypothetical protein